MNMKKNRLLFIALVVLSTLCALCLVGMLSVFAEGLGYGVIVGGVEVTESNAADVLGDGTVSYDTATKTLTLNNATITDYYTADNMGEECYYGIYSEVAGFRINLEGNNHIKVKDPLDSDTSSAVFSKNGIEVVGTGTLKTTCWIGILAMDDILIKDCNLDFSTLGITSATGNITIDGATLKAAYSLVYIENGDITVKNTTVTEGGIGAAFMTEMGDVTIEDSSISSSNNEEIVIATGIGSITVKNTTLNLTSKFAGIVSTSGKILLEGVSGSIDVWSDDAAYAIYSEGGNVELEECVLDIYLNAKADFAFGIGSTQNVTVESSRLTVMTDADKKTSAGIASMEGNVKVSNSDLKLTSNGWHSFGLYGRNTWLTNCKAQITATANTSINNGPGVGGGIAAMDGVVKIDGGSLNVTATGPDGGQFPSSGILMSSPTLVPVILNADVKLRANMAISSYPDLSLYEEKHVILASSTMDGETPIEFNAGNLESIPYLHIHPLFNITLNANGGTGEMTGVSDHYGEYTLPAVGFTAPEGKRFKGWALTADGEILATDTYTPTAHTTLYAIWEDIPHEHDYGTEWKNDEENHWKECACGDKTEMGAHADEDRSGKCDVCDGTVEVPHVHDYGTVWKSNAEQHWKECACGAQQYVGEHNDSNENGSCDVCGLVITEESDDGLGTGAIVGIVIGSVCVVGGGGFALYWFVLRKKFGVI